MKLFHRHNWVEIERFFARPPREVEVAQGLSDEMTRGLLFGITTILYRCSMCGDVKTIKIPGKTME